MFVTSRPYSFPAQTILDRDIFRWLGVALILVFFPLANAAQAAGETICAACKLQISQQVTFERQGFNATMTITNGLTGVDLTDISVSIFFTDAQGHPVTSTISPSDTGKLFFYQTVPGQEIPVSIAGGATSTLGWLIIPSASASGNNPKGTQYYVGATLKYKAAGQEQSVTVTPDYIFVQPQPSLVLDYFLPDQVYGSDPINLSVITPPIPFNVGVRVTNIGYGATTNLQINSGQPKLILNGQNLAVKFVLTGASVNDQSVTPSLLANFGTIGAQSASVARWVMTSSLSGTFRFNATFSHADSLGGSVTSLITATNPHTLVRDVLVDVPGRDGVRDFLTKDGDVLTMYESQGTIPPVTVNNVSNSASFVSQGSSYRLQVSGNAGYIYAHLVDPFHGQQSIHNAFRADGKAISLNNIWFSRTFNTDSHQWDYYFNLFDTANTAGLPYTIVFGVNPLPPVFGPLSDQILSAGHAFSMVVSATDPDGTTPVITSGALPTGAVLGASANGRATLTWTPSLTQAGNYPVTLIASEGSVFTSKTITLTVGTGTQIENWKEKYFPGITDPNIIGDAANPSGDGFANLLKYALGLDPTKQSPNSGILIGTIQVNGHTYLTLTYVARTDDDTLTLAVVGSNSPSAPDGEWSVETEALPLVSQEGVVANMQRFTIRDSLPIDTGLPRRFLKLRVTRAGAN